MAKFGGPVQEAEEIGEAAARYKISSEGKLLAFRRNRQLRDLEFRRLRDLIDPIARAYELQVDATAGGGAYGLDSPVALEEKSESGPYGTLVNRSLTCQTRDGDKLYFGFHGESQFRRPWPADPGLLSKGHLNVVIEGIPQAVVTHDLELWLRGDTPTLVVRDLGREVLFSEDVVNRAFRVLTGDLYPGVSKPHSLVPGTSVPNMARISELQGYYKIFDKLGIPRRASTLGSGLLRMALTLRPKHKLGNGALGSNFSVITRLPTLKRYELVIKETFSLTSMLRDHINDISRLDVLIEEENGPKLAFEIEATIGHVPFRATIRADYAVDPALIEVIQG